MTYSDITEEMTKGNLVARESWGDEFIIMVPSSDDIRPYHGTPYASVTKHLGVETISILPHVDKYDGNGNMICGYEFSEEDISATDWIVIKE